MPAAAEFSSVEGMPPTNSSARAAIAGSILVTSALVVIWAARLTVDRHLYVSELGADGEPTAGWFELALLMVVAGGVLIAWAGRGIRSTAWFIGRWSPSTSLVAAAGFFIVSSQVPCTAGCPLPVGDTFTGQDFAHTLAAVLAFAAACLAMLQASFARGRQQLRRLSMLAGCTVAVIAAAGGILSLLRIGTEVGGMLELMATTIAIGWLVVYGGSIAGAPAVVGSVEPATQELEPAR
jgi:hypothetical protein